VQKNAHGCPFQQEETKNWANPTKAPVIRRPSVKAENSPPTVTQDRAISPWKPKNSTSKRVVGMDY